MGILLNGAVYISAIMLAFGTEDVMQAGRAVGTASNQYLLGALVVVLIIVVLYRERQQNRQHEQQIAANRGAAEKAETAIKEANDKHEAAVLAAAIKADELLRTFALERSELYARMEKANTEMNDERRQRWTMMIDVIRENTIAFRGVRDTLDNLQRYLIDQKHP